jgi:chromosome partitioning protein
MKIIAVVNNKGGVGKTTSAVNLAAGIAAVGKRRGLLIDLDAQGSASLSLGLSRADLTPGTAEVILEGHPVREAIRPSSVKGLEILPGSMALASADLALSVITGREVVLKNALKPILAGYDFAVLDCPPSLGLLTVNALTAADFFIIPMTPDYLALEGLVNFLDAVEKIRAGIGGKVAAPLGILLVFNTEIRGNVRLKEAPSFGKSIFDYDNYSPGAKAYRELAKEVTQRIGQNFLK